jgi:hypothetical protein
MWPRGRDRDVLCDVKAWLVVPAARSSQHDTLLYARRGAANIIDHAAANIIDHANR